MSATAKAIEIEAHELVRKRWPEWLREQFERDKPIAVYLAGTRIPATHTLHISGIMPVQVGGNRPFRALTVGTSKSFTDTVSRYMDRNPVEWQGLLGRVWVTNTASEAALVAAVTSALGIIREPVDLRKGFVALYEFTEDETVWLLRQAQEHLIQAWDDTGIVEHLIRCYRHRRAKETREPMLTRGRR